MKPKAPEKCAILERDKLFLDDTKDYSLEEVLAALPSHVKVADLFFSPFEGGSYYREQGWEIWWKEDPNSPTNQKIQEQYRKEMEEFERAMVQYRADLKAFNEPKIREELKKAEKRVKDLKRSLEGEENEVDEEAD